MYKFSEISQLRLKTCDPRLVQIMSLALQRTKVDFGIAEGHRTIERQQELFKQDKSEKDGIHNLSKHNYNPSLAVDVYSWVEGKSNYATHNLCYLAGVIESVAIELGHEIRWGGNWDMDGVLINDQKLQDLVHFEIVK